MHRFQQRIYYRDTDHGRVVYYARYLDLLEIGRTEFLREKGYTAADLEKNHGLLSPIIDVNIRYKKPAVYDDLLTIHTEIKSLSGLKLVFAYKIYRDETLLVEAETTNTCVAAATMKPKRFPVDFTQVLS